MSFWIGQNTTNFVIFDIGHSIMYVTVQLVLSCLCKKRGVKKLVFIIGDK